jgi:hypothetical protein
VKQLPRGTKAWLICAGIGLSIHTIAAQILFPVDLIKALQSRSQAPLMVLTFLLVARIFLYFFVPGWGVYLFARTLLERQTNLFKNAAKTESSAETSSADPG